MSEPYGQGPPPTPARPWYKKKRFIIPGALLGLTIFAGALSDPPPTGETLAQPAPTVTVTSTVTSTATTTPPTTPPTSTAAPTTAPPTTRPPTTRPPTTTPPPPPPPPPAPEPAEPELTSDQENAVEEAENYISFKAFSREGLIDQLVFEDYSKKVATFAVDSLDIDYNEQAAKAAKEYLDFSSFSRSELQQQLEFEGYTSSQAAYGVKQSY